MKVKGKHQNILTKVCLLIVVTLGTGEKEDKYSKAYFGILYFYISTR